MVTQARAEARNLGRLPELFDSVRHSLGDGSAAQFEDAVVPVTVQSGCSFRRSLRVGDDNVLAVVRTVGILIQR